MLANNPGSFDGFILLSLKANDSLFLVLLKGFYYNLMPMNQMWRISHVHSLYIFSQCVKHNGGICPGSGVINAIFLMAAHACNETSIKSAYAHGLGKF